MVSLKWAAAAAVAAATVTVASAAPGNKGVNFAGYFPSEDVSMQARVDLDIKAMMDAGTNWAAARRVYTQGKNSEDEEDGAGLAKIQDWSTRFNKAGLQRTEPAAIAGRAFWGDWDFANRHLLAVLDGKNSPKYGLYRTGAWARTNAARKEMVEKLTKYTFVPLQVGWELLLTLTDYAKKEEEAPEHWDEAWAYYAGSLERGSGNGFSAYALAEKRAKNFGTMAAGRSSVNRRILRAMNAGKRQVRAKSAGAGLLKSAKCIRALLLVPSIQGCLRYSYRVSSTTATSRLPKEAAEAWAFCAAVLPALARANAGAAQRVRQQVFLSGVKRPNWPIVRAAFGASTLNKMGIRCADVGSLNVESPKAAHPVCKDGKLTNNLAGTNFC